jgi:ElaB/YqjD/DUF883 family membrane-anchored ribosome-binding protein
MHKQATKTHKHTTNNRTDFGLYDDLAKIKKSLTHVTRGVRTKSNGLLAHTYDDFIDKSTALQENVETYITAKPFKAVGTAAIVGLIIGLLLRK